ncbi:hypothetical protein ACFQJD_12955 [Haloplanus sp. GCM10025708]|uniref:hypothetical protein n=1 Tax=Haloferacaceae TaxID=1644056 RepID=UPI0036121A97
MVEHCDKCGTELGESQARHQRYRMESAADPSDVTEGCLCSDCFWEFEEWLEAESA